MRFQSKAHISPLLAIESSVAQCLECPARSRMVLGANLPSSPRSFVSGHVVRDEKCGLGKNLKIETICLNFSPSRFHLAKGFSLSFSGIVTAIEKQFNPFAFCLMLTGQVCRLSYALKFSSFFLIRSG